MRNINNITSELNNLKDNWDTNLNNTPKQLDANWVGVSVVGDWRLAKKLGAKKDYSYGWLLWSASTNDNGTNFKNEVSKICKSIPNLRVREYQL